MKILLSVFILLSICFNTYASDNKLINIKSRNSVSETLEKFENILTKKGIKVFIRIKHDEGAEKIGSQLRPTELIIFGKPEIGTPLMQSNQLIGLDLPMKVLVWEDKEKNVWFTYNEPHYLYEKYNMPDDKKEIFKKLSGLIEQMAQEACK